MCVSRAVAINVAANTTLPGFRAPIYPDGTFQYVPIPEREPTDGDVPTYAELGVPERLPFDVSGDLHDRPVHVDPEFAGSLGRDRYTYGDEHGVKAGPLSTLEPDDRLYFYATLSTYDPDEWSTQRVDWRPPAWGAYLIGVFVVAAVWTPSDEQQRDSTAEPPSWAATNAHAQRETFDAEVLVRGSEASRLFERAVPLSEPTGGADANDLVTTLSNDSGRGPWWRRVLRYDETAADRLTTRVGTAPTEWL